MRITSKINNKSIKIVCILGLNNNVNNYSKLCRWRNDETHPSGDTFYNQALNTLYNYCCRGSIKLDETFFISIRWSTIINNSISLTKDARLILKILVCTVGLNRI